MKLNKLLENYVEAKLALGGFCLGALVLVAIPILVVQAVEEFLKDLDITWPMYLILAIVAATVIVGVVVCLNAEENPGKKAAVVLAGGSAALTTATVMIFLYYEVKWMGGLSAVLALDFWWMTYRTFFPVKKKDKAK